MRLLLLLCSRLALRFSEALAITLSDYDHANRTVLVFSTKTQRKRTMPLTADIEVLLAAIAGSDPTIPAVELLAGRRRSKTSIHQNFRQLKQRAGVGPQLHFHDLRRTAATMLYRQTHDVRAAQQLLGHASLHATAYYLAPFDTAQMRELINSLPLYTRTTQ